MDNQIFHGSANMGQTIILRKNMIWQTKTVQIESANIQWDGSEESLAVIKEFINDDSLYSYDTRSAIPLKLWNVLEEQWLNVPIGHWVVKGLKGELYPCEPGAMDGKYFEVEEDGDAISLMDLIKHLRAEGGVLAGPNYIKDSEMVQMGEDLLAIADTLERYGVK